MSFGSLERIKRLKSRHYGPEQYVQLKKLNGMCLVLYRASKSYVYCEV